MLTYGSIHHKDDLSKQFRTTFNIHELTLHHTCAPPNFKISDAHDDGVQSVKGNVFQLDLDEVI